MKKSNWWAMFLSFFGVALLCAPFAVVSGYDWLVLDEPDREYECKGGSTCWSGETANMIVASLFGAATVIFAGITVGFSSAGAAGALQRPGSPRRSPSRCELLNA